MTTATTTKKGFDLARSSVYIADPFALCIVGGMCLANPDERGPLDTDTVDHVLYDETLKEALSEEFVLNVDAHGVMTPITIGKVAFGLSGLTPIEKPTVIAGRSRVRAARIVNLRRKARGEPPLTIECCVERGNDIRLMGAMISENEARRRDTSIMSKIAKVKRLLDRGVDVVHIAIEFCVSESTVNGWLALEDNATKATKQAIADGRISATAAAELARVKDQDRQNKMLESMLTSPARTVTAARKLQRDAKGMDGDGVGVGRRDQKKLLAAVKELLPDLTDKMEKEWWSGAVAALAFVLGEAKPDKHLAKLLKEVTS